VLKKKLREKLWFIVKVVLSLFAIVYVFKKVSLFEITRLIDSSNFQYLLIALLMFTVSKLLSASRGLMILNHYAIPISQWDNLKLYWTGMFYNLFLPGGIGGDIYKTVVINSQYNSGIKISAVAVLMDRIAGVAALIVLALLTVPFTQTGEKWVWHAIIGASLTIAGFIGFVIIFIPRLKSITGKLLGWSFMVQIFQIVSLFFIMMAFNIRSNHTEYLLIFLISSIAAMLPISVGGIGIRELVFFSVSDYFFLDQEVAVTISFTFYIITVVSSLVGMITALETRRKKKYAEVEYGIK
jgi:uncharacterized membrane protein YbhN (UPF0104 family)